MKKQATIVILAILVLLGLGWFVVEKGEGEKAVPDDTAPVATTTEQLADTASTTIEVITPQARISTEGWKTCRNEKYGYEFKYPGEWYVTSNAFGEDTASEDCNASSIYIGMRDSTSVSPEKNNGSRYMFVFAHSKESFERIFSNLYLYNDPDKIYVKEILAFIYNPINNKKMLRLGPKITENSRPYGMILDNNVFTANNNIYIYINNKYDDFGASSKTSFSDIKETILSTFKFLDN